MPDDPVVMSPDTALRVAKAVRAVERSPLGGGFGAAGQRGWTGAWAVVLRVTSGTPTGALYPAAAESYDGAADAFADLAGVDPVWLRPLDAALAPAAGDLALGLLVGVRGDDGRAVFAACCLGRASGSGSGGGGGGACCPDGVSLPDDLVVTLLSEDSLNACIGGLSIPVTLHPGGGPSWAPTGDPAWYGATESNPCGGDVPFQASFSCDGTNWVLVLHCGSDDGAAGSTATSTVPVGAPGMTCDPPNFTFSLNFAGSNPCGLASSTINGVVTSP